MSYSVPKLSSATSSFSVWDAYALQPVVGEEPESIKKLELEEKVALYQEADQVYHVACTKYSRLQEAHVIQGWVDEMSKSKLLRIIIGNDPFGCNQQTKEFNELQDKMKSFISMMKVDQNSKTQKESIKELFNVMTRQCSTYLNTPKESEITQLKEKIEAQTQGRRNLLLEQWSKARQMK